MRGRILILFADALSAPEVAWSLVDAGFAVTAASRRGRRPVLARCPEVDVEPITAPEDATGDAAADLVRLADRCGAGAVMPLDDAALWLCARVSGELDATVAGPVGSQAELALDKRK